MGAGLEAGLVDLWHEFIKRRSGRFVLSGPELGLGQRHAQFGRGTVNIGQRSQKLRRGGVVCGFESGHPQPLAHLGGRFLRSEGFGLASRRLAVLQLVMAEEQAQRGALAVFSGIQLTRFLQRGNGFARLAHIGRGVTDPKMSLRGCFALGVIGEEPLKARRHLGRPLHVAQQKGALRHGIFPFLRVAVAVDHRLEVGQRRNLVAGFKLGDRALRVSRTGERMTRVLQKKAGEDFHRVVVGLGLQLAPGKPVERIRTVAFRTPGGGSLAVKFGRLGEAVLTEKQLGLEQLGFGPLVFRGGRLQEGFDLRERARVLLRHETDQTVKAGIARGGGSGVLDNEAVVECKRAALLTHLAAGIGREEEHIRLRFGREEGKDFIGQLRGRGIILRLVFQPHQTGLPRLAPVGQFLVGRSHLKQGTRRLEVALIDGEQAGFDRRTGADDPILRRLGQTAQLAQRAVGQTGARIGLGQVENGALTVRVVLLLRGHLAVGGKRLSRAVGRLKGTALEKLRGQPQLRIAHVVRGEAERSGCAVEITTAELYFTEAVGGRTEKFTAVELREQLTVGRGGLGIALHRALAFAEPEQRRLTVDAARSHGKELLILRHGEVVHLLAVEGVGLLESAARRVIRQIGGRRPDGFGAVRRIDRRHGRRRAGGCHRFCPAHFGCGPGIDRFGHADLDILLGAKQRGNEQEKEKESRHDSGRPVAKATFQMLAVRQMSSTATM